MVQFDPEKTLKEHRQGLELVAATEKMVDDICAKGYSNIFFFGVGGTVLYAKQMAVIVKELGSTIPLFVENAADFCVVGNPHFSQDSLVVFESISGETKELIQAMEIVRKRGARVLAYVEKEGSSLAKMADFLPLSKGVPYYFWYTVTLRLMKNAGQFSKYDEFMKDLKNMPEAALQAQKEIENQAEAYALRYADEEITYVISSGNLEHWGLFFSMCMMEEMQWMRTRPMSASHFFHGPLEVIERDTAVMLIKGQDQTRPLMERVEKFVNRISAKVIVFDSAALSLPGIRPEFRGLMDPIVMRSVFHRVMAHLEFQRRHPQDIRRYYHHLDY